MLQAVFFNKKVASNLTACNGFIFEVNEFPQYTHNAELGRFPREGVRSQAKCSVKMSEERGHR